MALGVFRLEAVKRPPDANLVAHVLGETRPSTAHVHSHLGVGVLMIRDVREAVAPGGPETLADGRQFTKQYREHCQRARDLAAAQKGGKLPALSASWLGSGCPDTIDVHADASTIPDDAPATLAEGRPWTIEDCRAYGEHFDRRILSRVLPPGSYALAVHLDEKAVHVQAEGPAVVVDPVTKEYRVGNNPLRQRLARLAPGFDRANEVARAKLAQREAKAVAADEAVLARGEQPKRRRRWIDKGRDHVYLTPQAQMRLVHDLYAHEFRQFGVQRGKGGAKRHHERVDRSKAMDAKVRAVERELAESRERQVDAERRARVARGESERLEAAAHRAERRVDQAQADYQATEAAVGELEGRRAELQRELQNAARFEQRAAEAKTLADKEVRELEAVRATRAGEEQAAAQARAEREREEAAAKLAQGHEAGAREREKAARDQAERLEAANTAAAGKLEAAQKAREREEQAAAEARTEREREEAAAASARQQREDDEALGTRLPLGSARARGRQLRQGFEEQIAGAEDERDQARAELTAVTDERDRAVEGCGKWEAQAERFKRERDKLQAQVPDPRREEDLRRRRKESVDRQVADAWRKGVAKGLCVAGAALGRVFAALRVNDLGLWQPILDALKAGDWQATDNEADTMVAAAERAYDPVERSQGREGGRGR